MNENPQRNKTKKSQRGKSTTSVVSITELNEIHRSDQGEKRKEDNNNDDRRMNGHSALSINIETHPLSTLRENYLSEPSELDEQVTPRVRSNDRGKSSLKNETHDEHQNERELQYRPTPRKSFQPQRLSLYYPVNKDARLSLAKDENFSDREKKFLFYFEPIISGLILFPILVLFWDCGWNLIPIFLNVLNGYDIEIHLVQINQQDYVNYPLLSLIIPLLIIQLILLFYYLFQNFVWKFLHNSQRNFLLRHFLLRIYIFIMATTYIFQWELIWTIWDQYTPYEPYFQVAISFAGLFALICLTGHLSDLICTPFIYSYDAFQYCTRIGSPLLVENVKSWKVNLMNYILYEIFVSNLSIMVWRGLYNLLDGYLYPEKLNLSVGICLIIGYGLYFPLMYFQAYLESFQAKCEFWSIMTNNFPELYRNTRHFLAFLCCLFTWRGFWVLYDEYLDIFPEYYQTYLFLYICSFLFLCSIHGASSTNGPLVTIDDPNGYFPLYPHCYVSLTYQKMSRSSSKKPPPNRQSAEVTQTSF